METGLNSLTWRIPGAFPAHSRRIPGALPAHSRRTPGAFPAHSRRTDLAPVPRFIAVLKDAVFGELREQHFLLRQRFAGSLPRFAAGAVVVAAAAARPGHSVLLAFGARAGCVPRGRVRNAPGPCQRACPKCDACARSAGPLRTSDARNLETRGAGSRGKLRIVGREHERVGLGQTPEDSRGKVNRVEGAERRWEGVGSAPKNRGGHVDAVHSFKKLKDEATTRGEVPGSKKPLLKPSIERTQTLDLREGTGYGLVDGGPLGQPIGLGKHHAEQD